MLDPVARARYDERIPGPEEAAAEAPPRPSSAAPVVPPPSAWRGRSCRRSSRHRPADEGGRGPPRPPVFPAAGAAQPAPVPRAVPARARHRPRPPAAAGLRPSCSAARWPRRRRLPPAPVAVRARGPAEPPAPPVGEATAGPARCSAGARGARDLGPQISERTKVTRHHVENIEADRFEQLPPRSTSAASCSPSPASCGSTGRRSPARTWSGWPPPAPPRRPFPGSAERPVATRSRFAGGAPPRTRTETPAVTGR